MIDDTVQINNKQTYDKLTTRLLPSLLQPYYNLTKNLLQGFEQTDR